MKRHALWSVVGHVASTSHACFSFHLTHDVPALSTNHAAEEYSGCNSMIRTCTPDVNDALHTFPFIHYDRRSFIEFLCNVCNISLAFGPRTALHVPMTLLVRCTGYREHQGTKNVPEFSLFQSKDVLFSMGLHNSRFTFLLIRCFIFGFRLRFLLLFFTLEIWLSTGYDRFMILA